MSTKKMTRRRFLARAAAFAGMATVGSLAATCGATPTPEVIEKVVTQVVEVEKEVTKIVAGTPVKEVVKETVVVEKPVTTVKEVTKVVEVPAVEEKITLRVQTLGGVRGEKAYKFARMYEQLRPNMTLKNEDLAWGDTLLKQELLYGTGDLWDICYGHSSYAWVGAYKGWYMHIDDLLAATDAVPNYDDFFIKGVENAKYEGNTHAIIDFIVPGAGQFVMFNHNIFDDAGVPYPEPGMDMWGLAELARSVTDRDKGIFGFQNCGDSILRTENNTRTWGNPDYGVDGDTRSWIVSADNKNFR
jgi:ABC-type glycerol-3-phosphate transport system substrate-binding protein